MNCERIETQLIAYLDGRAPEAERREVETHLAACAACRTRAEEFGRVWNVLDEAPTVEPSLGFDARLRQRIAAEPRPRWYAVFVPVPRFALALALLLVLSVWISSTPTAPPEIAKGPSAQDEEFKMIENLQVLEDYDVLANFEALSELPPAKVTPKREM